MMPASKQLGHPKHRKGKSFSVVTIVWDHWSVCPPSLLSLEALPSPTFHPVWVWWPEASCCGGTQPPQVLALWTGWLPARVCLLDSTLIQLQREKCVWWALSARKAFWEQPLPSAQESCWVRRICSPPSPLCQADIFMGRVLEKQASLWTYNHVKKLI